MSENVWTTESVRKHVEGLHETLVPIWLRLEKENDGNIELQIAFLFMPDGTCLAVPDLAEIPKSAVPRALRVLAEETGSRYVAFAGAAMTVLDASPEEMKAWYDAGKSLSSHPKARDALVFSVDGPGMIDMIITTIDADGRPETTVSRGGPIEGRMANLSGRLGEN